jgi:hypothetical protein
MLGEREKTRLWRRIAICASLAEIHDHAKSALLIVNGDIILLLPYFYTSFYNKAIPASPTTPIAHEAALTFDAAPGVGDDFVALVDGLGLWSSVDVPLGLPDMFCWEISMPVLFLQWLL